MVNQQKLGALGGLIFEKKETALCRIQQGSIKTDLLRALPNTIYGMLLVNAPVFLPPAPAPVSIFFSAVPDTNVGRPTFTTPVHVRLPACQLRTTHTHTHTRTNETRKAETTVAIGITKWETRSVDCRQRRSIRTYALARNAVDANELVLYCTYIPNTPTVPGT